jgi:hypothetical protein
VSEPKRRRRHARQRQLLERAGERARKPGHRGDRREVGQAPIGRGVEQRARRHRLHAERGRRRHAIAGEQRCRQPRGQLRQAESIQTERRSARPRPTSRAKSSAAPREAENDQRFCRKEDVEQELSRGLNPDRRRRGGDNVQHRDSLPDAVPGTRDATQRCRDARIVPHV